MNGVGLKESNLMSEFGHLMYMFRSCTATKSQSLNFLTEQLPPNSPQECQCQIAQNLLSSWSCWTPASPHPHFYSHSIQFSFLLFLLVNPIIRKQRNVVGLGLLNLFPIIGPTNAIQVVCLKKLLIFRINLRYFQLFL